MKPSNSFFSRFSTRLIAITFIAGIIPVMIFGGLISYFNKSFVHEINQVIEKGQEEQWRRSNAVLGKMAEEFIRQKALDIAFQLELYLEARPEMTIRDLQKDLRFRNMAVQPIGKGGYTAIIESDTAMCRFHQNPALENFDLHQMREALPEFWSIIEGGLGKKFSHGYYRWQEADGQIREKFMYIVPIDQGTGENIGLSIAATTNIDEFIRPIQAVRDISHGTTLFLKQTIDKLIYSFRNSGYLFMGISILLLIILAFSSGSYLSRAVSRLRQAVTSVNEGNYDIEISRTMSGEIGELAEDFNQMVRNLAVTTVKKEQLEKNEKELKEANIRLIKEIDERKKAQEWLRLMKFGVDHANDGIFWLNSKGNFIYVNQSACDTCGYPQNELYNMNISQIDLTTPAEFWPDRLAILKQKKIDRFESSHLHKEGYIVPIEVTTSYIDFEGEEGVLAFTRDITDRKMAEEERERLKSQFLQAQKMESIGTLAGGIAHDFNNILFGIIGMAELLVEDLDAESIEYDNASEILTAAQRGSGLVQQILAFSRQSDNKTGPVRVQGILKEVIKLTRATIPSNISITENIQSDCSLVLADPVKIHQVVMNIMTNAYHALESRNGYIKVQLTETELDDNSLPEYELEPGKYIHLSVADSGGGISSDVMNKIFDPYFTTKEKGKGTGLGLSVVYGIVKDLKGGIQVESKTGQGTTFNIYIPAFDSQELDLFIHEKEGMMSGSESILIVDDEPVVAKLEKQMFERLGYQVTLRVHSIEALEAFKADPYKFDLVITDQSMPEMTGIQLTEKLKAIRANIPVVLFTGFNEGLNRDKIKSYGVDGVLLKPVIKSQAARMIRDILDRPSAS